MPKILIADDDFNLCENVSGLLRADGHKVDIAHDGEDALEFLELYSYDVAILDWDMPEISGMRVCEIHRQKGGVTPILMLTGKADIDSKVQALEIGADDYMTKPFHPKELVARLRALVRRPQPIVTVLPRVRNVELDPTKGRLFRDGQEIHLQPIEFSLAEFFLRNPGRIFTADEILSRVWDSEAGVSAETLYSTLRRVRKKLNTEGQPEFIRNIHGRGYILDE
jgi:DNA-binding response OmpR family regulator